jgi:itaconate CoA-transferase
MIQSESGFLSITGRPDAPVKAGCSIADISAGMYGYSNILTALIQRSRTGRGCRIDLSMLEGMVEWMSHAMYYAFDGAQPPARAGAAHATIYPYGFFPTDDGRTVMLGLQNEREWLGFCQHVLKRPELASDERFATNSKWSAGRGALHSIIVETFAALSAERVIARLEIAEIANARMNDMHDVWDHPQLRARARWSQIGTPAGMIPALTELGVPVFPAHYLTRGSALIEDHGLEVV